MTGRGRLEAAGVDTDGEVDLERVVNTVGTSWADKSDSFENDGPVSEPWVAERNGMWADKVSASADAFLKARHHMTGVLILTSQGGNVPSDGLSLCTNGKALNHKAEVPPIFLAYRRVSSEGEQISLVQVVTSVIQSLQSETALDAVQPMQSGWHIYTRTLAD